jgi:subtilisin family serine protease
MSNNTRTSRAIRITLSSLVVAGLMIGTAGVASAEQQKPTSPNTQAPRYAPGELVVRYQPGTSREVRKDFRSDLGATIEAKSLLKGGEVLDLPEGVTVANAVEAAQGLPGVLYAEPNYSTSATASPNDPLFDEMWSIGLGNGEGFNSGIDTPRVWNLATGSSDVTVAVVDSGIESTHPDLAPNMWANPAEVPGNGVDDDGNDLVDDVRGWDWVAGDNAPEDELGHGTMVAGIVGARGNNANGVAGINWDVRLMSLRVLDARGSGWTSDVADAFTYAGRMGADVVNASLAGSDFSQAMLTAIAGAPNTLFVVAAGNESSNVDVKASYPCSFPLANIMCVGATGQSQQLSAYSNYGTTAVDLAAPGDAILSTWPGGTYNEGWGTSFASPHVAGVAGLLKARHPEATAAQIRTAIMAGTDPLPSLAGRTAFGQLSAAGAFEQMGDVVPQEPRQLRGGRDDNDNDKPCSTKRRTRKGAKGRRSRHGSCRARSNRSK